MTPTIFPVGIFDMPNTKPFVQVACICERVLVEKDNVTSLIRVVDVFGFDIPPMPADTAGMTKFTAFVALKSGDLKGKFNIGLQLRRPDGTSGGLQEWPVVLEGGGSGANIKIDISIADPKTGLYWFDVLWGTEILTSMPLELRVNSKAALPATMG